MSVVRFEMAEPPPLAQSRMDIALFVGFVALRDEVRGSMAAGGDPAGVAAWLGRRGLPVAGPARAGVVQPSVDELLDVPVPIDGWSTFDSLFAWNERPLDGGEGFGHTYLGSAVRTFFAEGGRRCFVVRVGDPWALASPDTAPPAPDVVRAHRLERLAKLLPGFPGGSTVSVSEADSWRGIGYVAGLDQVSFVCLPDLSDVLRAMSEPVDTVVTLPPASESFLECSDPLTPGDDDPARGYAVPRVNDDGFELWERVLRHVRDLLATRNRQAQLLAAVPLALGGSEADDDLPRRICHLAGDSGVGGDASRRPSLVSSFVQLAYPWVETPVSENLPGGLEPPDGALAGVLARNALRWGTFFSAADSPLWGVTRVSPSLPGDQLEPNPAGLPSEARTARLVEHVSLMGRAPGGLRLLSDVTATSRAPYRSANVHRLVSVIVRAARSIGEGSVFEASNEHLWARLKRRLDALMSTLFREGALGGLTTDEAFDIRCDRSTMRQNDIDAGRVIAEISFLAASPIEQIVVVLAMDASGQLTSVGLEASAGVES